nr:hypothetical protein [Tanacetum cinerariifolium]
MSHTSGLGDVVNTQSKSWGGSDEEDDDEDDFKEKANINDNDRNDNDESDDERPESNNENMDEEEDDEVTKELYKDVTVNLGNKDTEMRNADQGALKQQNASHHFTPTPLPPLFFNPLSLQATPTPTPTASKTTTSLPALPNFTYVFKFNERVTNMEKDLSELKQVDQYAQALSSIPVIVDRYTDNKLGEAINKAIQAHNFDCRKETQAEKRKYIELVDSIVRTIIKVEVNDQLPQILPQMISDVATPIIEKNVTGSLEVVVLTRSRDERDKDRDPSAGSNQGTKKRKSSKDAELSRDSRSKEKKSSSTSKDASQSRHKSSGKSAHAEELSHTVEDLGKQQDQDFVKGNNDEQPANKDVTKADWFKKPMRPPIPDPDWSKRRQVDFRPP